MPGGKVEFRQDYFSRRRVPLAQAVRSVELQSLPALRLMGRRPDDFHEDQFRGVPQTEVRRQRVGPKAAARTDEVVDVVGAAVRSPHAHAHAATNSTSVRLHALGKQPQPAIAVSGIFVEHVLVEVACKGSAHDLKDVLVSIVVEVCKGYAVPFLYVAKTACCGDVQKPRAISPRSSML